MKNHIEYMIDGRMSAEDYKAVIRELAGLKTPAELCMNVVAAARRITGAGEWLKDNMNDEKVASRFFGHIVSFLNCLNAWIVQTGMSSDYINCLKEWDALKLLEEARAASAEEKRKFDEAFDKMFGNGENFSFAAMLAAVKKEHDVTRNNLGAQIGAAKAKRKAHFDDLNNRMAEAEAAVDGAGQEYDDAKPPEGF